MRILVFDPVLRSRLQVVAGLASLHDVSVVAEGIEPIKAVRRVLADVLLCSLTPEPQIALGLLRAVRTDGGHVPSLGVYERAPHRVGPDAAPGADGWLGDLDLLGEFVQALRSGPFPVRLGGFDPALRARLAGYYRRLKPPGG